MGKRTFILFVTIIGLTTLLLALNFELTQPNIAFNQQQAKKRLLTEILPKDGYDNDLLATQTIITDEASFATKAPIELYQAKLGTKTQAIIFSTIAPNGYNGQIALLVAVSKDLSILGVRVVKHTETPGLGDKMELSKSDWVNHFNNRSFKNTPSQSWRVRKDGGVFDSWTGATITPRAIVQAVKRVLAYATERQQELFPDHE